MNRVYSSCCLPMLSSNRSPPRQCVRCGRKSNCRLSYSSRNSKRLSLWRKNALPLRKFEYQSIFLNCHHHRLCRMDRHRSSWYACPSEIVIRIRKVITESYDPALSIRANRSWRAACQVEESRCSTLRMNMRIFHSGRLACCTAIRNPGTIALIGMFVFHFFLERFQSF